MWWPFGLIEVIGFFYYSNKLTNKWQIIRVDKFVKKVFMTALIIRLVWVFFSFGFFIVAAGSQFGFGAADSTTYHAVAVALSDLGFDEYERVFWGMDISDRGYGTYLGILYMIFNNSFLIPHIIKAVLSAFTCVLIYKLTSRTFSDQVGRMAAIFCMLMPNMIFYSGFHLKETEMVFLVVAYIERADFIIRSKKYNFINIAIPLILAGSLFFLRTVLGATAIFALFTTLVFSSNKVLGMGRRTVLIVWAIVAAGYFMGGKVLTEIEQVWDSRSKNQESSMEWRANRKGGNQFAKYAGGAVFAPLIVVIPFPTIVNTPNQENQQMINGGNYIKNIMAFFALFALLWIVKNKKWRDYLLIITFTFSYLIVIAMSAFAQSERFHQPTLPFVMILSAFGVSLVTNSTKKYYMFWLMFIFVAIIGWSWFKLAGRGMV